MAYSNNELGCILYSVMFSHTLFISLFSKEMKCEWYCKSFWKVKNSNWHTVFPCLFLATESPSEVVCLCCTVCINRRSQVIREVVHSSETKREFTARHSLEWKFLFLDHRYNHQKPSSQGSIHIVLSCFVTHAPLSEHAALLKYRRTKVNCNIYNIGAPAFSINSRNVFFLAIGACDKKRDYSVCVKLYHC